MKLFVKHETFGAVRSNKLTTEVNEYLKSFDGTLIMNLSAEDFFTSLKMRVDTINEQYTRVKPVSLHYFEMINVATFATITCEDSGACLRLYQVTHEL